jgi:hypothetical protein
MSDMKNMLKTDFKAHLQSLLFQKTIMQIVADTTLDRPFHEIVLEAYQEVLDEYKKILIKEKDNG